jgi:hypothetical protein
LQLLTSLGVIKHIEINAGIAYVLYEHYFSALLAYNVLNEIISADKKKSITVKLFTKEEEEEKQRKCQDKQLKTDNKAVKELEDKERIKDGQDELTEKINKGVFIECLRKNEADSLNIFEKNKSGFLNYSKSSFTKGDTEGKDYLKSIQSKASNNQTNNITDKSQFPYFVKASYTSNEENKSQSIFVNDLFHPLNQENISVRKSSCTEYELDNNHPANNSQTQPSFSTSQMNLSHIAYHPQHISSNSDSLLFPAMYASDYLNMSQSAPNQSLNETLNTYFKSNTNTSSQPHLPSSFATLPTRMYLIKYVCNYDIQIENEPGFQVTRRLIGNKGAYLRKILYDTCIKYNDCTTKIRLRGKGSGYKEGTNMQGNQYIS